MALLLLPRNDDAEADDPSPEKRLARLNLLSSFITSAWPLLLMLMFVRWEEEVVDGLEMRERWLRVEGTKEKEWTVDASDVARMAVATWSFILAVLMEVDERFIWALLGGESLLCQPQAPMIVGGGIGGWIG